MSQEELDYIIERIVEIAGDRISEIAAAKTVDKLYVAVGKGVLKRLSLVIGAIVVAGLAYAAKHFVEGLK